jgi:bacteriochlorophyllide a dehydrogenase
MKTPITQSKAIVFPEINKVELRDVPLPESADWDVTVELEAGAISLGTERWALAGKRPEGDVTFPCIPGYLSIGRVVAAGAKAREHYADGDRINFLAAKIPEGYGGNWMCGHLSPAVVHVDPSALGGFMGMPYVERVPEGLSSETASLAGLAAVACRGIDMADIRPDCFVVVVGQGIIGHAAAQICRLHGARVLTADTLPARVALSAELAAEVAVNSAEENLAERVMEFTSGQGADVVIDTTGSDRMINEEVKFLKTGGQVVFQGWYPPPSSLDLHCLQLKFASAVFPCGHSGGAVARCMRWMDAGLLRLEKLITHRFKPEQAAEAYDIVLNRPGETMGIVFQWD